jgi:hypothetical protein
MQVRVFIFGRIAIKTKAAAGAKAHKNMSCQSAQFVLFSCQFLLVKSEVFAFKNNCIPALLLYNTVNSKL